LSRLNTEPLGKAAMIFDEFSPSRTRRTLTAGGRTLRALGSMDC
jgi:hypothetical protein